MSGLLPRRIGARLADLAREEPVIALHGPRSVGKSIVLRQFAEDHGVAVLDLDEPTALDFARADPTFAVSSPTPVCIDEYQHAPILLDAIKARLNREGTRPGMAVLTGSTRHDALPRTAQALTGRLHTVTIWPLSQGELRGVHEDLIPSLRADPAATVTAVPLSSTTRADYADLVCAGGFPLAVQRIGAARDRWFDDYVRQSLERDALDLVNVRLRQSLAEVMRRLAGATGQVLNVSKLGGDLEVTRDTLEAHVRLLEDLFLVARLPAWGKTLRARASARPKIHVVDSGVAARLMGLTPQRLALADPSAATEFGGLLETFVVGELRKQLSWLDEAVTLGHWRTHDGVEVDAVLEFDDGAVIAFEVKAHASMPGTAFSGLRQLRDAVGDRFVAGIALTTGTRSYTYDDRLHVMPVSRLWQ